jgi:hypothetical protein
VCRTRYRPPGAKPQAADHVFDVPPVSAGTTTKG